MEQAYHPDFGQVVNYTFDPMPDSPDQQVSITIEKLKRYIKEDSASGPIQRLACAISGDPIHGLWRAIKPRVRFQQDVDTAESLGTQDSRKHNIVEVIIRPVDQAMLIEQCGEGVEDCDGFTGLTACILTALGIPCKLATVAADRERPDEFSHIYVVAYPEGQRIPLDLSHGPYPGWECPHTRIREWSLDSAWPALIAITGIGMLALRLCR